MAARTDLQNLYHQLCETRFNFIRPGEYDIRDVYALVRDRFPDLCDDSYLCSENCKSGYNSPEWKHKVRTALWDTKRRTDEVRSGSERGAWLFGVNLRMARSWRDSVLDALTRIGTGHTPVVDRQTLITEELDRIVGETESRGATPEQTLSRVLQDLRDEGLVEFLGGGRYRLVHLPVAVESADFSDEEIDDAIRSRLLRFHDVPTGTDVVTARRRRGQERLRELTLENYGHQCALCDVSDDELLVTSHIMRWADSEDARGDLANTLCLCRFHDALFELGYWSLADDFRVLTKPPHESSTVCALLRAELGFRRPHAMLPSPDYLANHRERHGFGP